MFERAKQGRGSPSYVVKGSIATGLIYLQCSIDGGLLWAVNPVQLLQHK